MIEAVIFDLDDTLHDEVNYCMSGFTAVARFLAGSLRTLSAERIFDACRREFTAGNRTRTFNTAMGKLGIKYDDNSVQQLIQVYRSHSPKIALPHDSQQVLSQLSSKYTLALLTDGFMPAQKLKVEALGIGNYFKSIIYTEELGRECWKPSAAGFEKLMETLNCKGDSMVYVADDETKDFIAPNKLGMGTIQVVRAARLHTGSSNLPGAAAQYRIGNIGELPDLLDRIS